jgi:hypothetical protein
MRVEDAGGGLAVDRRDMGDPRLRRQRRRHLLGRGRHVLVGFQNRDVVADDGADVGHPAAVDPVHQHEHLALARDQRPQRRLDGEGPASLHRYTDMGLCGARNVEEVRTHPGRDLGEVLVA